MANSFGFDINNPGASVFARGAVEVPQAFFTAIVEDIIINEKNGKYLKYNIDGSNIGEAKVRIVPNDANLELKNLKSAYPLDMNIQEFPFVGEQVIVFPAAGTLFYTRKLSVKRKLTDNIVTTTQRQMAAPDATEVRNTRELSRRGVPTNNTRPLTTNNQTPRLNIDTRPVRSSPGDIVFQGRFGNAIRVGSSLFSDPTIRTPQPNILLTAGFWRTPTQLSTTQITPYSLAYENINKDRSSIWMVSDQTVKFEASTSVRNSPAHLLSTPRKTVTYDGAQIFINSDRVILNSKLNEISLFSNREINLSSVGAISLDTENNIFLRSFSNINMKSSGSIYIEGSQVSIISKNFTQKVTGDYGISGTRIFIGKYGDATQPMVLGRQLASFLTTLIANVAQLSTAVSVISKTIQAAPAGVGTVAKIPLTPVDISLTAVNSQLTALTQGTNPLGAIFNSSDNFVSKKNS
jgi:hypothetical protein